MVSNTPNTQSYDFTHMYNFTDLRKPKNKLNNICKNSLMSIINDNKDFSKYKYMIHLAQLENMFSSLQAEFTIFIPSDKYIEELGENIFINMDSSTARHIIKSTMIDKKIPSELLQDSPVFYLKTKDPPNNLFITNISDNIYINNDVKIIEKDIITKNGIIHVIDKMIIPLIL